MRVARSFRQQLAARCLATESNICTPAHKHTSSALSAQRTICIIAIIIVHMCSRITSGAMRCCVTTCERAFVLLSARVHMNIRSIWNKWTADAMRRCATRNWKSRRRTDGRTKRLRRCMVCGLRLRPATANICARTQRKRSIGAKSDLLCVKMSDKWWVGVAGCFVGGFFYSNIVL